MAEQPMQWGLFWARLDPAEGSEQAGRRPVLVVSRETVNQILPIAAVVPLTTRKPGRRVYPTEVLLPPAAAGQPDESIAMNHQVRTVSTRRLRGRIGTLTDQDLRNQVQQALGLFLDLD